MTLDDMCKMINTDPGTLAHDKLLIYISYCCCCCYLLMLNNVIFVIILRDRNYCAHSAGQEIGARSYKSFDLGYITNRWWNQAFHLCCLTLNLCSFHGAQLVMGEDRITERHGQAWAQEPEPTAVSLQSSWAQVIGLDREWTSGIILIP